MRDAAGSEFVAPEAELQHGIQILRIVCYSTDGTAQFVTRATKVLDSLGDPTTKEQYLDRAEAAFDGTLKTRFLIARGKEVQHGDGGKDSGETDGGTGGGTGSGTGSGTEVGAEVGADIATEVTELLRSLHHVVRDTPHRTRKAELNEALHEAVAVFETLGEMDPTGLNHVLRLYNVPFQPNGTPDGTTAAIKQLCGTLVTRIANDPLTKVKRAQRATLLLERVYAAATRQFTMMDDCQDLVFHLRNTVEREQRVAKRAVE